MDQQHTDPIISQCITHVLTNNGHCSFEAAMRLYSLDDPYLQAARVQDHIGFQNFQYGRISKQWTFLQETYLSKHYPTKRFSAASWAKRLTYQLYHRL